MTAGYELGFGLRVVVKGKDRPPTSIAEGINKVLAEIGADLHLE